MQEALSRPKKGFARKLGGNSAAQDVKAYEEKVKAEKETAAEVKEKAAPAKEKAPSTKSRRKTKDKEAPLPVREVEQPFIPFDPPCYDFRGMEEPERTLQRVRALLSDSRLTHGERAAAALIVFHLQGQEGAQLINVKRLLTESRGFSCTIRDKVISKLSELGLVKSRQLRGKGTEIELLF